MLDNETKRRIDKARDILVGKIPDPKSQVEQITIALIYKFMDDMDIESVELGGDASFFTNTYEKYAWRELLKPTMGGTERLLLYSEAIVQMNLNPELPQLFRDIFKNAYLPYRDPETLTMFLKTIDEFNYDHSERLGDAFEYLLSVLGSQGDAGQFRTPRHIIDFMAAVVQPKKMDVIGDPACGTAGFLIAAYKFILAQNKNALNDVERKQLAQNLIGYDISPDMVRLSRVNLFLHRFVTPTIFEYDTLTSQEKWGDYFDVILANPPFMSPRGGITPHNRFSVQSNRSEVLFVDYIAEHLKPEGRAGIIVPEGIIFQSANAYKQLREMLVKNNYLYAVVSLPAGVFNPYSGVKTSILFIDKSLAKKTNNILFVKIMSDGFDLGAQRRANNTSDLTAALDVLNAYKTALYSNTVFENTNPIAVVVPKEKIAANGDYNLSADRYKITLNAAVSKFEMVKLGDVCEFFRGITFSKNDQLNLESTNTLRVATTKAAQGDGLVENDFYYIPKELLKNENLLLKENDILISIANSLHLLGRVTRIHNINYPLTFGAFMGLIRSRDKILPLYLFEILKTTEAKEFYLNNSRTTTNISNINFSILTDFEIPLPPLEIQRAIVSEIENYQRIIDGAKQVVQNYKPTFHIEPEWEMVKLGEVAKFEYGFTTSALEEGNTRFIRITDIDDNGFLKETDPKFIELTGESKEFQLNQKDLLVARTGATFGKTMIFKSEVSSVFASYLIRIKLDLEKFLPEFYWAFTKTYSYWKQANNLVTGGGQPQFNANVLKELEIPLPPLETQKEIVAAIEREQALVNANKELITLMGAKIAGVIARVWK